MSIDLNKQIVEAAIFASSEPLPLEKLVTLTGLDSVEVKEILATLEKDCEPRGIELTKVASGYRFQVKQTYAASIQELQEKPGRYSRAFLETLALIAYRQPITRGEIEEIRGIAVNTKIMKTFLEREWIKIVGHRETPGKPALFATTKQFLDYFNLKNLNELPALEAVVDLEKAEQDLTEQLTLAVEGVKPAPTEEATSEVL